MLPEGEWGMTVRQVVVELVSSRRFNFSKPLTCDCVRDQIPLGYGNILRVARPLL